MADHVITVTIERDGVPIFIGRIGPKDHCEITGSHDSTPARASVTATDQSAFIDADGEARLPLQPLKGVVPSAEPTQQ